VCERERDRKKETERKRQRERDREKQKERKREKVKGRKGGEEYRERACVYVHAHVQCLSSGRNDYLIQMLLKTF